MEITFKTKVKLVKILLKILLRSRERMNLSSTQKMGVVEGEESRKSPEWLCCSRKSKKARINRRFRLIRSWNYKKVKDPF